MGVALGVPAIPAAIPGLMRGFPSASYRLCSFHGVIGLGLIHLLT